MATLHIVNRPAALASCLDVAATTDTVLLIEDGVYAATDVQPRALLAIDKDAHARGVASRLNDDTTLIDYERFVALAVEHKPIVTWC